MTSAEPLSRGLALLGMRQSARDLWGEAGVQSIAARLPDETRAASIDDIVLPISWLPTRYILDWLEAVWGGPVQRQDGAFAVWVRHGVSIGFGRLRRLFLRLVSLERMAAKAPDLWRREHTHGALSVTVAGKNALTLSLRDHPYVHHPLARAAEAEVYRTILSLAGRQDVREEHALEDDALVVRLTFRV